MVTYVWRNLDDGYIQGMCDILAPLLVILEDESLTLECFTMVMTRLRDNFPHRNGMDVCLMNFRSLIQALKRYQIFILYRLLILKFSPYLPLLLISLIFTSVIAGFCLILSEVFDFNYSSQKTTITELSYDGIFRLWETIWAGTRTFTPHFPLFFGLAMVTNYRDVIVANNMDFTDMIKFFNGKSKSIFFAYLYHINIIQICSTLIY
ncbi:hypothetical protein DICVIV_05063 [Dictyocaulus viviparus]|uniref:Rab-GAP TBC domain-containing protein n=1 Tax=Dictyocaulus viviparus TaxID=29172 RepID=A0A0D8XWE1_DICVI|nr:hypothetical protein DICVIV_05063 [Dictyocaulus viviparus]